MVASGPATFADMLSREHSAEAAIYRGDPGPFQALWSHGDDVSLFGAFGPCKKGWGQVEKTVDWVASRYRDGVVSAEYEVVHEGVDLAYTVGYEIGDVALDGAPTARQRLRVTQIYRRRGRAVAPGPPPRRLRPDRSEPAMTVMGLTASPT